MTKKFTVSTQCFEEPVIMGILNTTPDSFSDGGDFLDPLKATQRGLEMLDQGAQILDIGGESTRPGAKSVSLDQELQRVIPVIEYIRARSDALISIDTSKALVMREAVMAGANIINDVCALSLEGSLATAVELQVPVCIMHMQGQPRSMQNAPQYHHVVDDVLSFFKQRIELIAAAGLSKDKLIIDPGFGFGKSLEHNYQLLANLARFERFELPLLVGVSRKSMFSKLLHREPQDCMPASITAAILAAQLGGQIFRVHDVWQTKDAFRVYSKLKQSNL
ncbi:dihydropteroate synthase [Alginatibacterium sediminis]|uniref:Dihydropteroate synthase n=1 Tax=Alginatibacterium sediminis TaxID=2164068 RepID=A0A420E8A5_9ALTE|nr:dihydropteroate synthase [Alginatibacterium sediminis]RKF15587.1 dihydropteroate synthase [Alginatibacterium sediminis]